MPGGLRKWKSSVIALSVLAFTLNGCSAAPRDRPADEDSQPIICGADLSSLPRLENYGIIFYNSRGKPEDPLITLSDHGVNTVRLRLWKSPEDGRSGFDEVRAFSERIHRLGLDLCLAVHYSDTWADPGKQALPGDWEGIAFEALRDSVYSYTAGVVSGIAPEYIQIGNEINNGFLLPHGGLSRDEEGFIELISAGVRAVRDSSPECRIIIHYAGIRGADRFFNIVSGIDYDIIGISYYPHWHGKGLEQLANTVSYLSRSHRRDVLIAETAYPFTLGWNDWTDNIVGLEEQLILPRYPATPRGQQDFLSAIARISSSAEGGIGFCYWGAELVAFDGPESKDGSPWENQALYGFDFRILPAARGFGICRK